MIQDRTRISRLIGTYIGRLMQSIAAREKLPAAPRKKPAGTRKASKAGA